MAVLLLGAGIVGCSKTELPDPYTGAPVLVRQFKLPDETVRPVRLQWLADTLFVSYVGLPRIDKYNAELELVGSIALTNPEEVSPTAFVLIDSLLVVVNHSRQLVIIYDRTGNFRQSFGTTPDGRPLSPFALDAYGGVAYIGDLNLQKVLAVSLVTAENITESGELILTIPSAPDSVIQFPSAVMVTPDGRLLVGDAGTGSIRVFTCDGRHIYDFERFLTPRSITIQGFDRDNLPDPSMQDSLSFDPSGVRKMGRLHVVDANNAEIHMYNPLGRYLGSYGDSSTVIRPSDIAISRRRRLIFVADPGAPGINVYKYELNSHE